MCELFLELGRLINQVCKKYSDFLVVVRRNSPISCLVSNCMVGESVVWNSLLLLISQSGKYLTLTHDSVKFVCYSSIKKERLS